MAERKQFFGVAEADSDLLMVLNESRERIVTEEELREQRISFAFGNSLNANGITKESVRHASKNIRLFSSRSERK
jgi:hypothetical protein